MKSKAKSLKVQSPLTKVPKRNTWAWFRYSFIFNSVEDCNQMALGIAASLRTRVPKLYFARYTNAHEARLDVICNQRRASVLTAEQMDSYNAVGGTRWKKVMGPVECEGSLAHAAAFDFVAIFSAYCQIKSLDDQGKTALWADVLHWANNMGGFDYVDEARVNLYSLERIMGIFEQSIKLGNTMAAAQKKAARKTHKPSNN